MNPPTMNETEMALLELDPVAYWRLALVTAASEYGLQHEVLEIYNREVAQGLGPEQAYWSACCEWDL